MSERKAKLQELPNSIQISSATMAMTLLIADKDNKSNKIEEMSEKLFELKGAGIDIKPIEVKESYGSHYSPHLDRFIGGLLANEKARSRSPLKLEDAGREFCKILIKDAYKNNSEKLDRIAKKLGMEIKDFLTSDN